MNKRKFLFGWCFLLLGASLARAEMPSPNVDVEYRYTAPEGLVRPAAGNEGVKLGFSLYILQVAVPQPVAGAGGYIMYGFRYSHADVLDSGWGGGRPNFIGPLQTFTGNIRFVKPLADGTRISALMDIGYFGEASDWGFDVIRLQGGVLYETAPTEGSQWGLGLYYAADFGQPVPLPLITYRRNREEYRIEVALPMRLYYWRIFPEEHLEAGIGYSVRGNQYHVNEGTSFPANKIKQTSLYLGPAVRWKAPYRIDILLDAGSTVYNKFEVWHGDTLIQDITPWTGWYAAMGISARF